MVLWSWYILLPGAKEIDIIKKSPKNLTAAVHYHLLSEINHLMCDTIKLYDALLLNYFLHMEVNNHDHSLGLSQHAAPKVSG